MALFGMNGSAYGTRSSGILDKISAVSGIKPLAGHQQIMGYKGDDRIAYQPVGYPKLGHADLQHID